MRRTYAQDRTNFLWNILSRFRTYRGRTNSKDILGKYLKNENASKAMRIKIMSNKLSWFNFIGWVSRNVQNLLYYLFNLFLYAKA